jgi:hypothetical protein
MAGLVCASGTQAECPDMRHTALNHLECVSAADVPGYGFVTGESETKKLT